jgi:hypothetical protein
MFEVMNARTLEAVRTQGFSKEFKKIGRWKDHGTDGRERPEQTDP